METTSLLPRLVVIVQIREFVIEEMNVVVIVQSHVTGVQVKHSVPTYRELKELVVTCCLQLSTLAVLAQGAGFNPQ